MAVNWMKHDAAVRISKRCDAVVVYAMDAVYVTIDIGGKIGRAWILKSNLDETTFDVFEDMTVRLRWDENNPQNPPIYGKVPAQLIVGGTKVINLYIIPKDMAGIISS
jgi:hypothetical protein